MSDETPRRGSPRRVKATFQFNVEFSPDAYGGLEPGTTAREACYALLRDGERWDWEVVTDHADRLAFIDAHYEGEQAEDAREALLAFLPEPAVPLVTRRRSRA